MSLLKDLLTARREGQASGAGVEQGARLRGIVVDAGLRVPGLLCLPRAVQGGFLGSHASSHISVLGGRAREALGDAACDIALAVGLQHEIAVCGDVGPGRARGRAAASSKEEG